MYDNITHGRVGNDGHSHCCDVINDSVDQAAHPGPGICMCVLEERGMEVWLGCWRTLNGDEHTGAPNPGHVVEEGTLRRPKSRHHIQQCQRRCFQRVTSCRMVRCGAVWCGVVWCGVVWCGVVWCGVVWCGVVWCGVVWCGVVWCGVG